MHLSLGFTHNVIADSTLLATNADRYREPLSRNLTRLRGFVVAKTFDEQVNPRSEL